METDQTCKLNDPVQIEIPDVSEHDLVIVTSVKVSDAAQFRYGLSSIWNGVFLQYSPATV